jgi:predicted cation transporter
MLEVIGIAVVAALVITLFVRPSAVVAIVLAVGVVAAAIVVSWHDIEQTRAQSAVDTALARQNTAAVTTPAPQPTHAGS